MSHRCDRLELIDSASAHHLQDRYSSRTNRIVKWFACRFCCDSHFHRTTFTRTSLIYLTLFIRPEQSVINSCHQLLHNFNIHHIKIANSINKRLAAQCLVAWMFYLDNGACISLLTHFLRFQMWHNPSSSSILIVLICGEYIHPRSDWIRWAKSCIKHVGFWVTRSAFACFME